MSMRKTAILSLVCFVFISFAQASDHLLSTAVDTAVESALEDKRIVGSVIMINKNGRTVYHRAHGMADREAGLCMWPSALFRLSSVSKVFTAMAAGALIEQDRLRLDDPISLYLPYFRPALPDGRQPDISVRHLLTFTAGLDYRFTAGADSPYAKANVSDGLDNENVRLEENLRRIASAPLLFEPGSDFRYSLALDVLGGVIAAANNSTFQQAMDELVLAPLGLTDTGFSVGKSAYRLATPYYNADPAPLRMEDQLVPLGPMAIHFSPSRATNPNAYPSGGAGMISTASDIMKLLECMRQGGAPLVGDTLMREIGSNQTGELAMMPGNAFGLGVGVVLDQKATGAFLPDGTLFWSGVYGNFWWVDRKNGISAVILTNTAFEGMSGRLVTDVQKAVYDNF